jgi:hypothetical protein
VSLRAELLALYQEWHRLTGEETRAIEADAWDQVRRIQAAKASLPSAILNVSAALEDRDSGGAKAIEEIEELLAELILLERANQDAVTSRLAMAHAERTALGHSTSRLRDIRRAYVLNVR